MIRSMSKLDEIMGCHVPASDVLATRELLLNRLLLEHLLAVLDTDRFKKYLAQREMVANLYDDLKMI